MTIRTLRDVDPSELAGLPVLLRVDLNVPMLDGVISDDTRIRAAVATIEWLSKAGAAIIIASHFGRPRGIRTESLSLRPLSHRLSKILGKPVAFAEDCIGDKVREQALALGPGECLLLENLRFHPGETANDLAFARQLS
ncbi:MAG: phosphoglycerate kinase, partial [Pseudomonadota bacterium]